MTMAFLSYSSSTKEKPPSAHSKSSVIGSNQNGLLTPSIRYFIWISFLMEDSVQLKIFT